MTPVVVDCDKLEPGSRPELITSSDQKAAIDLPAAITPDGDVVSRWTFTDAEREWIARGADVYVFTRTHGRPFQPISLVVGDVEEKR